MRDGPTRMFALACVLLGVWVLTYWLYEPGGAKAAPRVTLDPREPLVTQPVGAGPSAAAQMPSKPVDVPKPSAGAQGVASDGSAIGNRQSAFGGIGSSSEIVRVRRVVEPQFRDYLVQKGDLSFDRIAARKEVFGDGRLGPVIARANPLVSPDRLKPGITVLRVPLDAENIQGKLVWVEQPAAEVVGQLAAPPVGVETPKPPAKTYTTQPEDTLSDIAKKFYGKASQWRRIYEANRGVIANPDRLAPGVVIRIPEP